MEAILILILVVFGPGLIAWIFTVIGGTTKAAVKSAVGKGSFSENMEYEFKEMGPFQIRIVEKNMWEEFGGIKDDPMFDAFVIEGRGVLPHKYKTHIGFVISVLDDTGDEPGPILSLVDAYQEKETLAYQQIVDAGTIDSGSGYIKWVRVGEVFKKIIHPPEGGKRRLKVILRIVNMDDFPDINLGFHEKTDGIIDLLTAGASFYFDGKGFQETAQHRDEARSQIIKLAMSVAMADGSLDDSEGNIIKHWIKKAIAPFSIEKQENLKKIYNDALRTAYQEARSGDLSVSSAVERLEELAETPQKYEAIELCFEVMAADGIADESEIKTIKGIAEALDLDFDEIEKLRDKHLVNMELSMDEQASIETILHIDPNWSRDQIKKHLAVEFAKWNNRLNTLTEGQERENAQKMLDLIAEGRKKYV